MVVYASEIQILKACALELAAVIEFVVNVSNKSLNIKKKTWMKCYLKLHTLSKLLEQGVIK